jgi:hypothetical protein
MTENTETKTTASKTPTHFLFLADKDENGKSYYTRIGAGWAHRKGGGINFKLDGNLVAFTAPEKSE